MHLKELDANLLVVLDALLVDASVTKAAERLGRSPSAVSHALSNLREAFGDELFVRAGQRLVPTAKALDVAPTIHVIVSGIESLLRPNKPFEPGTQERALSIACDEVHALTVLRELRVAIAEVAPRIDLSWVQMRDQEPFEAMRSGEVDFVLSAGIPPEASADFVWQDLGPEAYAILARRAATAGEGMLSQEDLTGREAILAAPSAAALDNVLAHFAQHGVEMGATEPAESVFLGALKTVEGDRLLILPARLAHELMSHFDLRELRLPFPSLTVPEYLGWHKSRDRDECHRWIRAEIAKAAGCPNETDSSL